MLMEMILVFCFLSLQVMPNLIVSEIEIVANIGKNRKKYVKLLQEALVLAKINEMFEMAFINYIFSSTPMFFSTMFF